MVGVDPALVLCYRDEYKQTLGDRRGDFHVQLVHEWLHQALATREIKQPAGESRYLFAHCTEVTALPATLSNGRRSSPASARGWRISTSAAAAWRAPTAMR